MTHENPAVRSVSLVLLHSPIVDPSCWGETPEYLGRLGFDVVVVDVKDDDQPPFAARYIASAAAQVRARAVGRSVVLVGHSGAGPLLPGVADAIGDNPDVAALVYCDANLARPAASRLELMQAQVGEFDRFGAELANGRRYPDWTDQELAELVPSATQRKVLLAGMKARSEDFYLEPLPYAAVARSTAHGYLRLCQGYERPASQAQQRGWPVIRLDEGHFHALVDPDATALALNRLVHRLVGR